MKNKLLTMICVLSSFTVFAASKNYRSIETATDGSVTITGPQFQFNNQNYGISFHSDMNGVCKLFGYESVVANSVFTEMPPDDNGDGEADENPASIRIGAAGTMAGFDNRAIVHSLSCTSDVEATPSRDYRFITHSDDGSVVIREPYFKLGSDSLPLSAGSDKNGICKLYGFGPFVEGSLLTSSPEVDNEGEIVQTRTVSINNAGKFSGVRSENAGIYAVACSPK